MEQESCELCKYLKLDNMDRTVCKRFPKSESKNGNDYCGEFQINVDVVVASSPYTYNPDSTSPVDFTPVDKGEVTDVQKKRGRPKKDNNEKGDIV